MSTNIVKTLHEREWVKVVGHRDVPGRPAIFATTREFLAYFNLTSLSDMPTLAELRDIDELNTDLFADFEAQALAAEVVVGRVDDAPLDPHAMPLIPLETAAALAPDVGESH